MRPNELTTIPGQVSRTEADADLVFDWFVANYGAVTARMPAMRVAYMPYVAAGCSTQRLESARKFFGEPAHRVDGTESNMTKVAEMVTDCVSLRGREGRAVDTYLAEFAD